jgi:hypothetical protein
MLRLKRLSRQGSARRHYTQDGHKTAKPDLIDPHPIPQASNLERHALFSIA